MNSSGIVSTNRPRTTLSASSWSSGEIETRTARAISHSTNTPTPNDPASSALARRSPVGQPASSAARATKPPARMAGAPITIMNSSGRVAGPETGSMPDVWLSKDV